MLFYLLLIATSSFVITAFPQNLDNTPVEMAQVEPVALKSNGKQENTSSADCTIPDSRNTPCMLNCPMNRNDCNPVCGTDGVSYINQNELACARHCGKNVKLLHNGICS
ncbi:PREDICTED: uncharacterized protein LOC105153408 [Acromyrmex echinatior]|uniref:uncharacterized protein LOC105153408 n=1 Tax=Acromyrmex echinatior TaxID=103372 RepID=UPI000580CE08|nr:PREDICTED: uncharacterized protein LOC105153408 [Acromyrmex echinatior]